MCLILGLLMIMSYKRTSLNSILENREGERLENEMVSVMTLVLGADFGLIHRFLMSGSNLFVLYS